jgi:hypothetical protein
MTGTPLFDPADLDPEERALWRSLGGPEEAVPMTVSDLMGFAYICTLELGPVPKAVDDRIRELDPDRLVAQYFNAVRRARQGGAR